MQFKFSPWRSIKTRVTLFMLAIFVISIWSLALIAGRMLRDDMQLTLGEQQFSTVSLAAAQVNGEMQLRLDALESAVQNVTPQILGNDTAMATLLRQRPVLQVLFNGGTWATRMDGIAMAEAPPTANRLGINFMDRDHIARALNEGKTSVGRPVMGHALHSPVIGMATPIRDTQGVVIGALVGVINLGQPNFLDKISDNQYGKSGGYLLIAPQYQLFVTATDKSRALQATPPAGSNAMHDKYMQGFEGFGVTRNSRGVDELTAAKGIPVAGWFMVATLPAAEAFAVVDTLQLRLLLATLVLTLLAGSLTWWATSWMLRHQLSPMLAAAHTLARSDPTQTITPLPIARQDEVGELIGSFNLLVGTLAHREALHRRILDTASVSIFLIDMQGRITQANQAMATMFGRALESLIGEEYVALVHPQEREEGHRRMLALLASEVDAVDLDRLYLRADQTEFWGHLTGRQFFDANGHKQGLVGVISDVTAVKAHQTHLEHVAHFDALTSLPNRVLLADRLQQSMAQALRRRQPLAVAFLDLDGFKAINDHHGHDAGDQLLVALSARMKQALRDSDTLARMGGDEFVAVLVDLNDAADSLQMIDRLLVAAAQPVQVGGQWLQVSASLGVTFYPQTQDVTADQLLRQADQAMYQAKLAGKNRYHVFDAAHDSSLRGHHESLEHIRHAMDAREFVLYYQPKVNMRTGAFIGAEALIRWQHPQRGLLPPAVFLPVIEDHPLAIEVGEWVIDTALTQIELWRAQGLEVPVSVNIGARQLQQPNFIERLHALLLAHPQVDPQRLELEVLETSALEDVARVSHVIDACRKMGVSFALDDFGTGYSSLTYLKRLPAKILKIDQSFVRDMLDDPDDLAILEGVIGLANAFRRDVIAEGVETVEHGEMLLRLGCDLAQGYGIARPMPAQALPGWVTAWAPDTTWGSLNSVQREDFPLLFAGVEHRAWSKAMEDFLRGTREAPPALNPDQCHFGQWLAKEGLTRNGTDTRFKTIDQLHQQAHALGGALCDLHSDGQSALALARLGELHAMRDALLAQLKELLPKSAQPT